METIVGRNECPINLIEEVISPNLALRENWSTFATRLGLRTDIIRKLKTDLLLNKSNYQDVIRSVLEHWVGQEGSEARLTILVSSLEQCGAHAAGENLLRTFNLPSNIVENSSDEFCDLVVGSDGCSFKLIYTLIRSDPILREKWSLLALQLDISRERIKTFEEDLLVDKISQEEIIRDVLLLWLAKEGSRAKLVKLIQVIEEDCGCIAVGETLRLSFNLPCKGENLSLCWDDLSPGFQQKVEEVIALFWPGLELIDDKSELFGKPAIYKSHLKGKLLVDLSTGRKPTVFKSNIPEQLSYYIDRTLISRNIISSEIFNETDSPDIFIFSGMARHELSKLAARNRTSSTSEQLNSSSITARFLLLDQLLDFEEICKRTDDPVHLINYEGGRLKWIKSKGDIKLLQKFIDSFQDEMGESEIICKLKPEQPICLSDTPGMGKSVLLQNIGRGLQGEKEVIFLQCNQLAKQLEKIGIKDKSGVKKALKYLICEGDQVTESIFTWMFSKNDVQIELLLDALDEVNPTDYNLMLETLKLIKSFKSIRLWVTTRPHLMPELERCLGVLGYNIKAFSDEDQLNFLTSYWKESGEEVDPKYLERLLQFAKKVVKSVKSKMRKTDGDICGIPLQCLLIGELYEKQAVDYAKNELNINTFPQIRMNSIMDLYEGTIEKKFKKFKKLHLTPDFTQNGVLFDLHVWLSLELIFPHRVDKLGFQFDKAQAILLANMGIVELSSEISAPKFIHRTFAEYFIAKFVSEKVKESGQTWGEELQDFLFEDVFKCKEYLVVVLDDEFINSWKFVGHTTCYFLNSIIEESSFKAFKLVPHSLSSINHSCVNDNFFQLFKFINYQSNLTKEGDKLLLITAQNSSPDFLLFLLNQYKKEMIEFKISLKLKVLRIAIRRGDYAIFDILMKDSILYKSVQRMEREAKLLLHDCVKQTKYLEEECISEKIEIMKSLVKLNPFLLEQKDEMGNTPILSEYVHVRLLLELLENGANPIVKDKEGDSLLHLSVDTMQRRYTPEEYHLLVTAIPAGKLELVLQTKGKDAEDPLLRLVAVIDPLLETLQIFKSNGADFNAVNTSGLSALAVAIQSERKKETIKNLIELGADPGWQGNKLKSLLHHAAWYGNLEAARVLLEGPDLVNVGDEDGDTPLDYCVKSNCLAGSGRRLATGLLLKSFGGHLSEKHHQSELLSRALKDGNVDSAELLQSLKVDSDVSPNLASNTLVKEKRDLEEDKFREFVWRFIESGGRLDYKDSEGNSLLHLAINRKEEQAIRDLIKEGADPNATNNQMETPLHRIAFILNIDNRFSITKSLIESGADVFAKDIEGKTFLHNATMKGTSPEKLHELAELLNSKMLLKLFQVPDSNQIIPLELAAFHIEILKETLILIQTSGFDFDSNGYSLLVHAITGGRSSALISSLIQLGANQNILDTNNESLLHISAKCGNLEACKYFVEEGLDVNGVDVEGNTPLHKLAFGNNNAEIVELLLENGADTRRRNLQGKSAVDIAMRLQRNWELIEIIEKRENFTYLKVQAVGRRKILHEAVEGIKEPGDLIRILLSLIKSGSLLSLTNALGETFLHSLFLLPKYRLPSANQIHELLECLCEKNQELFSKRGRKNGATPIQLMVERVEMEERTLLLLFSSGVDFNSVDKNGDSLLAYAIRGGRTATFLSSLVMLGADLKSLKDNFFHSLFDEEIEEKSLTPSEFHQLVLFLVEEDYAIQAFQSPRGENDSIPLHLALKEIEVKQETLELLHSSGLNFNLMDEDGWTVLTYAIDGCRSAHVLKTLIRLGSDWIFNGLERKDSFLHVLVDWGQLEQLQDILSGVHSFDINCLDTVDSNPLHRACFLEENAIEFIQLLIEKGGNVNAISSDGFTPLHYASLRKDKKDIVEIIKLFIDNGADALFVNQFNQLSFLHLLFNDTEDREIISSGDFHELSEYLVKKNLSNLFESTTSEGETPLHFAFECIQIQDETFHLLHSAGVNFNVKSNLGLTYLAISAGKGCDGSFLLKLIRFGADWRCVASDGNSLLHLLAQRGQLEQLGWLVEQGGFDLNQRNDDGSTPLHLAVASSNINAFKVANFLSQNGADAKLKNNDGHTPLHSATLNSDKINTVEIIKLLINSGSDALEKTKKDYTFMHMLFFKTKGERTLNPSEFHELVEFLVDKNLLKLLEIPGPAECNAFHFALFQIEVLEETLSLIHSANVNFNLKDEKGKSLLFYAVEGKRSTEFLSYLIMYEVDWKCLTKHGSSLLHISAELGTAEALKFFLELGELDINGIDGDGDTPLHCAVQQKVSDEELILKTELLIKNGAEKGMRNNDGLTPIEVALRRDDIKEDMKDRLVKLFN